VRPQAHGVSSTAAMSAVRYELTVERPGASDEVSVRCETAGDATDDLRARVREALRERTGIGLDVELVPAGALPRSDGKAARVIDHRRPHA
jgi:phenylacetate-CoA ligase